MHPLGPDWKYYNVQYLWGFRGNSISYIVMEVWVHLASLECIMVVANRSKMSCSCNSFSIKVLSTKGKSAHKKRMFVHNIYCSILLFLIVTKLKTIWVCPVEEWLINYYIDILWKFPQLLKKNKLDLFLGGT